MTSLGLAMIVRDEAPIIGRCLRSVRDCVQAWTVVDTGSSDGTPELVEEALAGKPGRLIHSDFKSFGEARSELIAAARGAADYSLVLDADHTLESVGELPTADAGYVRFDGDLDYALPLLLSSRIEWKYRGKTHEYLDAERAFSVEQTSWRVREHNDGSSRVHKFERDLDLLLSDYDEEEPDPRTVFYLAETYKHLGRRKRAARFYRKRARMTEGFDEERFYAALQLGRILESVDWLVQAMNLRPWRLEPYYELASIHRRRGEYASALLYAAEGLRLPYPESDLLFLDRSVFEWGLQLEHSAAAWWLGDRQTCARESALLLDRPLPPAAREVVKANLALCS